MISEKNAKQKMGSVILAVIVAVTGSLPFFLWRDTVKNMAAAGYIGLFIACFLTNATVFLPASGIAFTVSAATALNPFLCSVIGGIGTALGELISYFCGRFGNRVVNETVLFAKIEKYIKKHEILTVFVFAFLPFPVFDLVGVTAGIMRMSVLKYVTFCCAGKILKMLLYVFLSKRWIMF